MTVLNETINLALEEYDENIRKDDTLTPEAQAFVIRHVHYTTDQLHYLSKAIREAMPLRKTKSWRMISGIQAEMMAQGQRFANLLWSVNLSEKITSKIEDYYGISFSALRIHPYAVSRDGQTTIDR